jgi:hypothetical protein
MRSSWLLLAFAACLDPTEVKVRLTSDACDSIAETEIFLGNSTAASATTSTCSAEIGSIVMIPASARDATFTVRVSACDKTKAHCIKASRRVGFVAHTPLELPISLDRSCIDKTCEPEQTCSKGSCVPEDVSKFCVDNVCTPPPPADAGPGDAGPACPVPWVNAPNFVSSQIVWHFDDLSPHKDAFMNCAPISSIGTTPGMTSCGNAAYESAFDGGASIPMALGCENVAVASGTSFRLAFWFKPALLSGTLVQKGNGTAAWKVLSNQGVLQFVGVAQGQPGMVTLATNLTPGWHSTEIDVVNGVMTQAYVDKNPVMGMVISVGPTPQLPIFIGPLQGAQVDELYIYP